MLADSRVAKTKLFVERLYCMTTPPFRLIYKIVYIFFVVEYGTNPTRMFNKLSPETREQIKQATIKLLWVSPPHNKWTLWRSLVALSSYTVKSALLLQRFKTWQCPAGFRRPHKISRLWYVQGRYSRLQESVNILWDTWLHCTGGMPTKFFALHPLLFIRISRLEFAKF